MKPVFLMLLTFGVGLGPGWAAKTKYPPPPIYVAPEPAPEPEVFNEPKALPADASPKDNVASLETLAAPLAQYPDSLIAIILPAATHPLEIVQAARFVRDTNNLSKLDQQPWDRNVKAVAKFPDVIQKMDTDLTWTINLGQTFQKQTSGLMSALTKLRASAVSPVTLKTNGQQSVVASNAIIDRTSGPEAVTNAIAERPSPPEAVTNTIVEPTLPPEAATNAVVGRKSAQEAGAVTNNAMATRPAGTEIVYLPQYAYTPAVVYPPVPEVVDPIVPVVTFGAGVALGAVLINSWNWSFGISIGVGNWGAWGGGWGPPFGHPPFGGPVPGGPRFGRPLPGGPFPGGPALGRPPGAPAFGNPPVGNPPAFGNTLSGRLASAVGSTPGATFGNPPVGNPPASGNTLSGRLASTVGPPPGATVTPQSSRSASSAANFQQRNWGQAANTIRSSPSTPVNTAQTMPNTARTQMASAMTGTRFPGAPAGPVSGANIGTFSQSAGPGRGGSPVGSGAWPGSSGMRSGGGGFPGGGFGGSPAGAFRGGTGPGGFSGGAPRGFGGGPEGFGGGAGGFGGGPAGFGGVRGGGPGGFGGGRGR